MEKPFLIVDLEATCWDGNVPEHERTQIIEDMEIIEFGCVITDRNGTIYDSCSFLVRPVLYPQLSGFCMSLTSIKQEQVDQSPTYVDVLPKIDSWLEAFNVEFWGSWGNYDKNQIQVEFERHKVAPKFFSLKHVNLKKCWRKGKPNKQSSALRSALEYHDLGFEGTSHRGIVDALNISRLMPKITWK